ncbi:HAD family hydrolase [Paractinoplanes atraurantiacus]|uniref:Haloacid dehalogenase superfamily, subfamily IA, variant 3 with third motif having DD or ED n=1 Tax=Paractinoplanes atraurantiacus TaxID=1036182 RepID=A0A285JZB2_9ACTN|nr:haloacid dehalogenase superfamily, subfamily IA, variant 3 with third motif having DD or ED [Actinoplanes atraurantiacus]
MLPLPEGEFDAYLFDCDGTIADSMPLHYVAWQRALAEWGAEFPEELFYAWGGRTPVAVIQELNAQQGLAMPVELVNKRREQIFEELLPGVTAVPEVLEHIEAAYGKVPFAVVSGSSRESVTASLTALGLLDRFEVMVCAGEYLNGKPDPECFLIAAEALGAAPSRCVVFEDAELGLQAAAAAGMAAVRVPPPWQRRAGTAAD